MKISVLTICFITLLLLSLLQQAFTGSEYGNEYGDADGGGPDDDLVAGLLMDKW